jgi:hypothetical protein
MLTARKIENMKPGPKAREHADGHIAGLFLAGFREGERRGQRAQGLEADLLQGVGEKPALELDAFLSRAFAGLEFVQGVGAED